MKTSFVRMPEGPKPVNDEPPVDDHEYTDDDAPDAPPSAEQTPKAPPKRSILETHWIDLAGALEFVTEEPPAQTWLLKQSQGGREQGVFPRGKTGLLTAAGGVGKSYVLIQLALAVASGGFWLDTFRVVEPGHVLLALGEEDAEEIRRRLWRALNALELDLTERAAISERIHLLPLHGVPIALTHSPVPGIVCATDFATSLRDKLQGQGIDWSLVILDPLSRWAGGGTEANNEAATRFVQVVETLTSVRGAPAVLVAHHSSQASTQAGKSDARGVTGIRDGFRWQASMDAITSEDGSVDGVRLSNPKSNYSLRFHPVLLVRNLEPGTEGTLRLAREDEAAELRALLPRERQSASEREQAKTTAKVGKFEADLQAVLAALPQEPASVSRGELLASLALSGRTWGQHTLETRMAQLMREGRALDLSGGSRARPRQYCRPADEA